MPMPMVETAQLSRGAELLVGWTMALVIVEAMLIWAACTASSRTGRRVAAGASVALVLAVGAVVAAAWWYFSQWELTF